MKRFSSFIFAGLALAAPLAVTAQVLQDWQFNEADGTGLLGVANTGSDAVAWDANIGDSFTTGSGVYRIRRAIGGTHTAYASVWNVPSVTWLVVDLDGWAFSPNEGGISEDMRFGFSHTTTGNQFAEIWMGRRTTPNEVFIQGVAELRSGGGEWIPPIYTGLTNEEERPVRLVLRLDRSSGDSADHHYSVYFNIDGAGYVLVGTGSIDTGRAPNYIRFRAINSFADPMDPTAPDSPMEFVDVNRIYMTTADPIDGDIIDPPAVEMPEERIVHDWHFDEEAGVSLSASTNSAGELNWTTGSGDPADDIGNSFTTGDGAFRVQRIPGGGETNFVRLDRQWAGKQWMVVDFRGWNLVGDPEEWMQFGFIDHTSPETTAEFRLRRWIEGATGAPAAPDPDMVYLSGRAFASINGAETIDDGGLFPAVLTEPLRLVLEYDETEKTYAIYSKLGDGEYELFGEAATDPNRGANALRFFVSNSFSEEGEFVDVERVFLTNRNPMLPVEGGYAGWAEGHFPDGGSDAEEAADPDGDDVSNLLEYVFGLDPNAASRDGVPTVLADEATIKLEFRRDRTANDLTFSVLASSDLLDWTEIASATGEEDFAASGSNGISVVNDGEVDIVTVTDSEPIAGSARRFLRLEITGSAL